MAGSGACFEVLFCSLIFDVSSIKHDLLLEGFIALFKAVNELPDKLISIPTLVIFLMLILFKVEVFGSKQLNIYSHTIVS